MEFQALGSEFVTERYCWMGTVMEYQSLVDYLQTQGREAIEYLLGTYHGPYSFGIIRQPGASDGSLCFRLSVPDNEPLSRFPSSIDVQGQPVQVVVVGGFEIPSAPPRQKKKKLA